MCNYTVSAKHIINGHLPLYITPCIQICTTKPVFSLYGLWNSLSDVIYSKSVVFSLKHVHCSQIRLNGGVSFITFRVHVYKIL